jgi:hypothetical protein
MSTPPASKAGADLARIRWKKAPRELRACATCGTEIQMVKGQRYCSTPCGNVGRIRRYRAIRKAASA